MCFQSKMQERFKKEWHTYHATSALYCLAWASREICAHIEEFKEESSKRGHFTAALQTPVLLQDKPAHVTGMSPAQMLMDVR